MTKHLQTIIYYETHDTIRYSSVFILNTRSTYILYTLSYIQACIPTRTHTHTHTYKQSYGIHRENLTIRDPPFKNIISTLELVKEYH